MSDVMLAVGCSPDFALLMCIYRIERGDCCEDIYEDFLYLLQVYPDHTSQVTNHVFCAAIQFNHWSVVARFVQNLTEEKNKMSTNTTQAASSDWCVTENDEKYADMVCMVIDPSGREKSCEKVTEISTSTSSESWIDFAHYHPVHTAVNFGHYDLVRTLLELGFDIHQEGLAGVLPNEDYKYDSSMEVAIKKDDSKMMILLDPYFHQDYTTAKYTKLHYACKYGAEDCFYMLIENGDEDIDATDCNGRTPLMTAVQQNSRLVDGLLRNGASVRKTEFVYGYSALEMCVELKSTNIADDMADIVDMLVSGGANVQRVTSNHRTSVILLCHAPLSLVYLSRKVRSCPDISRRAQDIVRTAQILVKRGALQASHGKNVISEVLKSCLASLQIISESSSQFDKCISNSVLEITYDLVKLFIQHGASMKAGHCHQTDPLLLSIEIIETIMEEAVGPLIGTETKMFQQNNCAILLKLFAAMVLHGAELPTAKGRKRLYSLLAGPEKLQPFSVQFVEIVLNAANHERYTMYLKEFHEYCKDRYNLAESTHHIIEHRNCPRSLMASCRASVANATKLKPLEKVIMPTLLRNYLITLLD